MKVCFTILLLLHAVKLNNLSLLLSFLPSLRLQYGCTALQTARGKRPQVALCVYVNMLNMHALLCSCERATAASLLVFFRFVSFRTSSFLLDICFACAVIRLSFHPSAQIQPLSLSLQSVHPSLQTWLAITTAGHSAREPEHGP